MSSLSGTLVFGLGGDGVSAATATTTDPTDHVAAALNRLCQQFKDKQGIIDLVTIFAQRYQDLEIVFWALLTQRTVYTAVGAQLDTIGAIVGQPRSGMVDFDYRRYIFARIATNRSDGLVEDLISISKLILNDSTVYVQIDQQGVAAVVVRILNITVLDDLANILLGFLQSATEAGVRLILETQYVADSDELILAIFASTTGVLAPGNTTIPVDSTAGFPTSGTLTLDGGVAGFEDVTYTGITPTSFIGVSAVANAHVSGSGVVLTGATANGKGMGDTSDGTIGGELSSARDAQYP